MNISKVIKMDEDKKARLNNILKSYLFAMIVLIAYTTISMIRTLPDDKLTQISLVYNCELAELAMYIILLVCYVITFVMNLTKKYHRNMALFTIRLFTIFTLVDMIIYILVSKVIIIDGIQYIAFENILLIIISYLMDVVVRKIYEK